jgi:hypothetical protein
MVPADQWHACSGICGRHVLILASETARWEIDLVEFAMQYVLYHLHWWATAKRFDTFA